MSVRAGVPLLLFFSLFTSHAAFAEDERRVVSPDGQIEFNLFIGSQPDSNLVRLAYQVSVRGKLLIDTSYLGLDLYEQEPFLGESLGLMSDQKTEGPGYHSLTAHYMQNGSLGRRLNMEVRVYNDGIAFRYIILKSTPVERIFMSDEATEFALPHDSKAMMKLPFVVKEEGFGPVAITEIPAPGFPLMTLADEDQGKLLLSRLTRKHTVPDIVFDGQAPFTCPWRVIVVGFDKEHLLQSQTMQSLAH